ncbi:hypothetical protein CMQ_5047 [Grosmannia clavigera kw1407]|uniref:Uncharacterized protein n=1 Tax=Grosmannia clavigera (strain kw1407 / UAMH 11150) TaxID=655863 RepID=F0XK30_GROCL|nr:uncharacterized protein CMQ_5047 [Grosmannia clavigera kw1407]EFX01976.1 hypothetical protein CMQ_5047 [Grosmannia clavigera kw1407]
MHEALSRGTVTSPLDQPGHNSGRSIARVSEPACHGLVPPVLQTQRDGRPSHPPSREPPTTEMAGTRRMRAAKHNSKGVTADGYAQLRQDPTSLAATSLAVLAPEADGCASRRLDPGFSQLASKSSNRQPIARSEQT